MYISDIEIDDPDLIQWHNDFCGITWMDAQGLEYLKLYIKMLKKEAQIKADKAENSMHEFLLNVSKESFYGFYCRFFSFKKAKEVSLCY